MTYLKNKFCHLLQQTKLVSLFSRTYKIHNNLILGIECTFDDTGAAVADNQGNILGESLFTQAGYNKNGLNPYMAQQTHRKRLPLAVKDAMEQANVDFKDVQAVATATKPGVHLCLDEGLSFSKALVSKHNLLFIPVHHMEAHLLTVRMTSSVQFPYLTLLISGGHCLLCLAFDLGEYVVLGKCLDHSPGAVIDKFARSILPSSKDSGVRDGKFLEKIAQKGDRTKFSIPLPQLKSEGKVIKSCDFSFSGILSNALRKLQEVSEEEHKDLAASFQHVLTIHVCHQVCRSILFCEQQPTFDKRHKVLVASGGVACNSYLRRNLQTVCNKFGWELICPPVKLCTDNGAMIAWTGMEYLKKGLGISKDPMSERYYPKCEIGPYIAEDVRKLRLKVPKIDYN